MEANNGVFALDVRADGATFATAGRDGGVRVYDERTGRCATRLAGGTDAGDDASFSGHADRVFGLRYLDEHADVLVSGGWDNTLRVWDARVADGRSVSTLRGPTVCGDAVDAEPDGTGLDLRVLVASWRDRDAVQVGPARGGGVGEPTLRRVRGAKAGVQAVRREVGTLGGHPRRGRGVRRRERFERVSRDRRRVRGDDRSGRVRGRRGGARDRRERGTGGGDVRGRRARVRGGEMSVVGDVFS